MIFDHSYTFLHIQDVKYFYPLGRLAMPLFAFAFSYGLATKKKYSNLSTIKRLFFFGLITSIPFIALGHVMSGWWPLNIMFTFLISTIIISILTSEMKLKILSSVVLFIVGGIFVEYNWAGLALIISFWSLIKRSDWISFFAVVLSLLMLNNLNHNFWATLALPLIFTASKIDFPIPRIKHFFYYFYPLQLSLIWILNSIYN